MRGEFINVWVETRREIWTDLFAHELAPPDLFCELYREVVRALRNPLKPEGLAGIVDDREKSREAFEGLQPEDLRDELSVVRFVESAFEILEELGGDQLSNFYFLQVEAFIGKYSLRYDLRRPCIVCPTLPGVFSSLIRDLRTLTATDPHLNMLMNDFENAVRDLRKDCSDTRIKTCIQKQVNLIEALARDYPGVTATELGKICDQLGTWPHSAIPRALSNLYGFTSDYPGIRHGGTPASALRAIDMRDMIAMSILLVGFVPYVTDRLDARAVYGGI
ncbi:MAG TPA: hypothetical protein VIY49_14180 [Bryobacteraceae bacterium]